MKERYEADMRAALDKFLDEYALRNMWIKVKPTQVYVRKGPLYLDGRLHAAAVTVANMSIFVTHQRRGYARVVFEWMEGLKGRKLNGEPITAIYVENVFSERLMAILIRHGWDMHNAADQPSFYKNL